MRDQARRNWTNPLTRDSFTPNEIAQIAGILGLPIPTSAQNQSMEEEEEESEQPMTQEQLDQIVSETVRERSSDDFTNLENASIAVDNSITLVEDHLICQNPENMEMVKSAIVDMLTYAFDTLENLMHRHDD